MTLLRLIRHGQTLWNAQGRIQGHVDIPLNDEGRAQAHGAADGLRGLRYAAVVTSPLERAASTAAIIATDLGLSNVEIDPQLVEQTFGAADGRLWSELDGILEGGPIPGAETHLALAKRATSALRRIGARFAGRNVIIVSHGAFINAVNRHATHGSGMNAEPAANGSIHDIVFSDGQLVPSLPVLHHTDADRILESR
ncbi:histidine phosphatase family protein [Microbacterium sp. NPDC089320]|uniref:histidine phosphatase family protein n=1 Tax=Microbacterium sp. NPDC089320 TaxID=3155182 RepID=UPI0034335327